MKPFMIIVMILCFAQAQQDLSSEPVTPQTPTDSSKQTATPFYPDNAVQITQFSEVAQAVASANSEIMLATDVLRSEEIAEALRVAIVSRGVPVYILTPQENIEDPSSYLVSLALAGAHVRFSPIEGSFITIDRQSTLAGALVSGVVGLPGYENKERTILVPDEIYTAPYVEAFYTSFEVAPVLDPETMSIFKVDELTGEGTSQETEGGE